MSTSIVMLGGQFKHFGERECLPSSPLYARLALGISEDTELLRLAALAQAGPVPNLFFGAIHYLLLSGISHPLAAFYPSLNNEALRLEEHDPFPHFRAFCLEHARAIEALIATRRVQTNEVRRCACLLPAFATAAQDAGDRPLALIEIGASAGLNLLWDAYAYEYDNGQQWGNQNATVRLRCAVRGPERPPIPAQIPNIAFRVGLDLNPIDVRDADAALWLRALIWPEQRDRAEYLQHALTLAQATPPLLLAGDATAQLPGVLAQVPAETTLCLYHTFTLNQFPPEARERLHTILAAYALNRDFSIISIEWRDPYPPLVLTSFRAGARSEQILGYCDPHGAWLEWQPSSS
jgi:hypothetical protein